MTSQCDDAVTSLLSLIGGPCRYHALPQANQVAEHRRYAHCARAALYYAAGTGETVLISLGEQQCV